MLDRVNDIQVRTVLSSSRCHMAGTGVRRVLVCLFALITCQSILFGQEAPTEQTRDKADSTTPDPQIVELQQKLKQQAVPQRIETILQFHNNHTEHSQTPALEAYLRSLKPEDWLQAASARMQDSSPEDSGCVDGWLPIASTWLLKGDNAEARDAIRSARAALPRVTEVDRLIESTIDLCQHEAFNQELASPLIKEAVAASGQVADENLRGIILADLSGLAAKFRLRDISADAMKQSLDLIERKGVSRRWQTAILRRQLRAAAWTAPSSETRALASDLENIHLIKQDIVADGYIDVAISAARRNDRSQFVTAMLKAEAKLAALKHRNAFVYQFTTRVAEANLIARRWRPAVIIANNVPDPRLRASILFRVLISAPQEVRTPDLTAMLQEHGHERWAVPAVSGYVEHRLRSGDDILSVMASIQKLPLASQQASALAGIARVSGAFPAKAEKANSNSIADVRPKHDDPSDLLASAELAAEEIDDPLKAAFAWLQIARTHLALKKAARYQQALSRMDDCCFDAWTRVWNERPPVKRSFDGTYYDDATRYRRTNEIPTVEAILACYRHLSQMQIEMGDARGATETMMNLANAAGFIDTSSSYYNWSFLHIEALSNRSFRETGVGPNVFSHAENRHSIDSRPIVAAWSGDAVGLVKAIDALPVRLKRDKLPHATGELAILYAQQNDLAQYRNARRAALSQITQNNASLALKNVLAYADALAGEYTLAESNLTSGFVPWFGDANRARSLLAVGLAKDQKLEAAIRHATKVTENQPLYRANAWEAISRARFRTDPQSGAKVVEWCQNLKLPNDQVSAFCGLAAEVAVTQR